MHRSTLSEDQISTVRQLGITFTNLGTATFNGRLVTVNDVALLNELQEAGCTLEHQAFVLTQQSTSGVHQQQQQQRQQHQHQPRQQQYQNQPRYAIPTAGRPVHPTHTAYRPEGMQTRGSMLRNLDNATANVPSSRSAPERGTSVSPRYAAPAPPAPPASSTRYHAAPAPPVLPPVVNVPIVSSRNGIGTKHIQDLVDLAPEKLQRDDQFIILLGKVRKAFIDAQTMPEEDIVKEFATFVKEYFIKEFVRVARPLRAEFIKIENRLQNLFMYRYQPWVHHLMLTEHYLYTGEESKLPTQRSVYADLSHHNRDVKVALEAEFAKHVEGPYLRIPLPTRPPRTNNEQVQAAIGK